MKLSKILIMFFILLSCISIGTSKSEATTLEFKDVSKSNIYYDEISYLVSKSVISGYSDGTFRPNNNLTRRQAAVMLSRELKKIYVDVPAPKAKDLSRNDSAYNEIASMIWLGIFKNEDYFKPNENMTREDMAYALSQAHNLTWSSPIKFIDVNKTYWAYKYIDSLAANSITTGYSDGTFRPLAPITRAHFSVFLYRTIHNKIDLEKDSYIGNINLGDSYENVKKNLNLPILKDEVTILNERRIHLNGVKLGYLARIELTFNKSNKLQSILFDFRPENDKKEKDFYIGTLHNKVLAKLKSELGDQFTTSNNEFAFVSRWSEGKNKIVWANHNYDKYTTATLNYFIDDDDLQPIKSKYIDHKSSKTSISGKITWIDQQGQMRPDDKAFIYLIPEDFDFKDFSEDDMWFYLAQGKIPPKSNLFYIKTNSNGGFSIPNITPGNYFTLVVSRNVLRDLESTNDLDARLTNYFGSGEIFQAFKSINYGIEKYYFDDFEVIEGKELNLETNF